MEAGLIFLNLGHIRRHADEPPACFQGRIPPAVYARSVVYSQARGQLALGERVYDSVVLICFVGLGGLGWVDGWFSGLADFPLTQGVVYLLTVALLFWGLSLPFQLVGQFGVEARFGFNKTTLDLWLMDRLKGLVLTGVLGGSVLYGVLWFMAATGHWWWLWVSGFVVAVSLALQVIYPLWIAPWFNRFEPLEDGELKAGVEALVSRLGFRMRGIYRMDASRRSGHGNAYFAGFGAGRRIVLFDTLLNGLKTDEVIAVLAHEIGHWRLRHIGKRLALSVIVQLAGFYALSRVMVYEPFYQAFGFSGAADYRALAVFGVCVGVFVFWIRPLFAAFSRAHEFEADAFAVQATGSAEGLSSALLSLSRDNLSNLTPHPMYSFYYYSHPSLHERFSALEGATAVAD